MIKNELYNHNFHKHLRKIKLFECFGKFMLQMLQISWMQQSFTNLYYITYLQKGNFVETWRFEVLLVQKQLKNQSFEKQECKTGRNSAFARNRIDRWATTKRRSDGLDLEVQADEREDQALEVLDQVVEGAQALHVLAAVDVDQRADLAGGERDVLVAHQDLQLLAPHAVRLRPQRVVLLQDLTLANDPLQLLHHALVHVRLNTHT